jgi:hypothetical protein
MYKTKIILDSVAPSGGRLTTFEFTFPRIILAEFNTHRMISRNSASSRAIPVKEMIDRVSRGPFVPTYFGKNQKGMQAEKELEEVERQNAEYAWREWVKVCLKHASIFKDLELHKQLANRVLESVNWHTVVATATEWSNYFALRDNAQAAPEIRESAHAARELYEESQPRAIEAGEYHLPYVSGPDFDGFDLEVGGVPTPRLCLISVGRCAAATYGKQDYTGDPDADVARAERLRVAGHMSPFEHVAEAMTQSGWEEYASSAARDWVLNRVPVGNLWGWLQYRKAILNEHDFGKVVGQ